MDNSILVNHAIENVWCEPFQDYTHILKPQRITPNGGGFKSITVDMYELPLPNYSDPKNKDRFHVYQIGFQWNTTYNISLGRKEWVRASTLMVQNKLLLDTYFENGCMINKDDVYIYFTERNNMLVAIRLNTTNIDYGTEFVQDSFGQETERKINLENHTPIMRFYSSEYYRTSYWRDTTRQPLFPVKTFTQRVTSSTDFAKFMTEVTKMENEFGTEGKGMFWVDGYVESRPKAWALKYKDRTLTVVWESAIRNVVFLKGSAIPTFISTLDKNYRKYILLSTENYGIIDYQDDVDVYLVKRTGEAFKGVYVTRFKESTIRQMTHNCYSLDSAITRNLLISHPFLVSWTDLEVMLVVRNGGMRKGVGHQAVRIEELYKLKRESILEAMSGVNSLVPEWRADYLESSDYCKIMRSQLHEISDEMVERAYGYNAAAMVAEPLYHKLERIGGQRKLQLPPSAMLVDKTTYAPKSVFMYDDNGYYIGYRQQLANTETYVVPNELSHADSAEVFAGYTSETLDGCNYAYTIEDEDLQHWGFRCYLCSKVNGIPNELWNDVTDSDFYTYTAQGPNGKPVLTWNKETLDNSGLYPCVKTGKYTHMFITRDIANTWTGYMSVTVKSDVNFQGVQGLRNQRLEPGVIDVMVNGITMIEGLDYIVKWPTIVIANKQIRPIDYKAAEVVVRSRGWCNPTNMKHYAPRDIGWIKDGLLSFNGTYDPRKDRNIRLIIDGALYDPDAVVWTEDQVVDGGLASRRPYVDGRAYLVGEVYTVVEPWSNQQSVPYRNQSVEIDTRVGNYLTPRLPEPEEVLPTVSELRWGLYSPFISALLHQFVEENWLSSGELSSAWSHVEVEDWIKPFANLIDFDPSLSDHDANYVWIYPHPYNDPMKVSREQYRFLDYVNRNYLKSKVRLNANVIVEN